MSRTMFWMIVYFLAGVLAAQGAEFQPPKSYSTGGDSFSVAVGDLNGDGRLDLVVENFHFDTVSVLLGNSDGTFQPHVDYPTAAGPYWVAVGDFNGDSKLDIATANYVSFNTGVSVLLGRGDGTFASHTDYATGGTSLSITVGDFNRDGKLDLATGDYFNGTVSVLLGKGDGTFQTLVGYLANARSITVGDVNGDSRQDIVGADDFSGGVVLLGNGDGTFQPQTHYTTAPASYSVAVGDFNRDGKVDLATANYSEQGNVSVLLGKGDGTFPSHVDYSTGGYSDSVAVGDFNGDGKLDLAVANYVDASVSVLLGNGDGSFGTRLDYGSGTEPQSVAIADFNLEGAPDLVLAAPGKVNVLLNSGGTLVTTKSSLDPSHLGQPVTFTTAVTASLPGVGTPTGTVTFKDGATTLGNSPLISGRASLTTSSLTVGNHKIKAHYSGDSTFNPHNAAPGTQRVRQ